MPGLRREEWTGASYSDDEFRELAEIAPGVPFIGTGGLGERVWSGPAITVTGIDAQPVDEALNAVVAVRARQAQPAVHPEQDPERRRPPLVQHLEGLRPFGIALEVEAGRDRQGLRGDDLRPGLRGRARCASRPPGAASR